MEYIIGLSTLSLLSYGLFYILRKQSSHEHNSDIDIPPFLRKDIGDNSVGSSNSNWTEIFPFKDRKDN